MEALPKTLPYRVMLKRTVISMPSRERAIGGGTQHFRRAANSSSRLLIEPLAFSACTGVPAATARFKKLKVRKRRMGFKGTIVSLEERRSVLLDDCGSDLALRLGITWF
jgi:hypothetical protein